MTCGTNYLRHRRDVSTVGAVTRGRLVSSVVAMMVVGSSIASCPDAIAESPGRVSSGSISPNLLMNPGFDASKCRGGYHSTPPDGWTVTEGDPTTICWRQKSSDFPTLDDPHPRHHGSGYAGGGQGQAVSVLSQVVSLAEYGGSIDMGLVRSKLSGYLGGWSDQDDSTIVRATWLDAGGERLGEATIGPVSEADRDGQTGLLQRTDNAAVPVGTRSAVVTVEMTREEGSYDDGYADALALRLQTASPTNVPSWRSERELGK